MVTGTIFYFYWTAFKKTLKMTNIEFSYEIGRLEFLPWLNKKAYNIFSDLCRSIFIENVDGVIFISSGRCSTGVGSAVLSDVDSQTEL